MAKYDTEYLQKLVSDSGSSVFLKKSVKEILLQPWHLRNIQESVAGILNLSLCKYDASLDGLLLGYQNAKRLGDKAPCHVHTSQVSVKIEAEFYIFQPKIGNKYKGVIHNLSVAHVGCLLYNHFNISLPTPPEKVRLLKAFVQGEVTFILEEFNLTGELPFFRGQLTDIIATMNNQPKKTDMPKLSLDVPANSKMDKPPKSLSLQEKNIKPDKKKRLSLRPPSPPKNEEGSSDSDSDHMITPFQRPRSTGVVVHREEESPSVDRMKSLLKSMRDSPLKGIANSDGSISDVSLDFLSPKSYKLSQNSQSVKASPLASQSAKSPKSQSVFDLPVDAKSPGSKKSGSQSVPIPIADDSSSSSEDSEGDFKKAPVLQTPAKQPTQNSSPFETVKSRKSKPVLSLAKRDVEIKNVGGSDALKPAVPTADDSSDDDESSSEDSEEKRKVSVPVSKPSKLMSPLRSLNASFATSTQKTPQKLSQSCLFARSQPDVSSSEDNSEDEADPSNTKKINSNVNPPNESTRPAISPVKACGEASSDESDSDTSDKTRVDLSKLLKQFNERSGNSNQAKVSSSEDSTTPLGNLHQKQPKESSDSSDSEVDAPKTPEIRSYSQRLTAQNSVKNDKSLSSSTKASHSQEETSSESDCDEKAVTPFQTIRKSVPDSNKSVMKLTHKNPLLNQTCFDASVHNRSPLACSTPTAQNTNLSQKKLLLSLKRPIVAETLKDSDVKADEPKHKKKKGLKVDPESKLLDSGFEDSKVKRKKKKGDNSKSSKNATKEEMEESACTLEELRQRTLEMECRNQYAVTQTSETRNPKKCKKSKAEVVAKKVTTGLNPILTEQETDRVPSKHPEKDRRKKAEKRSVEELKNLGGPERELERKAESKDESRKSKKRKLSESKEFPENREEIAHDHKKRRLFSARDHDSISITNIPIEPPKPSGIVVPKPKKSSKKRTAEMAVQVLRDADKVEEKKKSEAFSSEPLLSLKKIESGSKKKDSKVKDLLTSDNTMGRFLLDVVNKFTDDSCDSKKKKKKKKSKDVEMVKSSTDVIPPVEKPKKVKKDKLRKTDVAKGSGEPVKDPTPSVSNLKVCPPPSVNNQVVPKSQTDDLVNLEKKSKKKKKEKRESVDPGPVREFSPAISTDSAVTGKKKKTAGSTSTLKAVSKETVKQKKGEKKNDKTSTKQAKTEFDDLSFDLDNLVSNLIKTQEKKKKKKEKHKQ